MNRTNTFFGRVALGATVAVVVCAGVQASTAAPLNISDATFVSYSTNVAKLVAVPAAADGGLPAEAGTPSFHFDASRTNEPGKAWTFSGGTVTRIPSLSNDRFLTADFSEATWQGWSASVVPVAPEWVFDDELGACVVDFGSVGSKKAMTFDAQTPAGESEPVNALAGIGTVFAVVKNRGGWLMGGSTGGSTAAYRYAWHRGYSYRASSKNPNKVDSPIIGSDTLADIRQGKIRLNGQAVSDVYKCGFSGGWDYLTLRTKTATAGAFGLGIGDARTQELDTYGMQGRSGGIAFAELIVYPTILSDDLCKRIEAILAEKWFGGQTRGYGSHAAAAEVRVMCTTSDTQWHDAPPDNGSGGMQGVAEVSDGDTLSIGKLRGGRSMNATFTKTGTGRLEIGDASELGGKLVVEDGTLAFPRRAIPSSLPTGAALRFDASAENAVTTVGGYVTRWRNDGDETLYGQVCYAGAENDAARPVFVANAVNGKPAVDFGVYATNGVGCVLHLMTNNNSKVNINYPATYVAVLSADEGGGHVLGTDSMFTRGAEPTSFWKPLHAASSYWTAWMNGLKIDFLNAGYKTPDYQVTAVRAANGPVACIGGSVYNSVETRGGLKICELVVYKVPLSERQLEDAQAFLAWKWLGQVLPGYAAPSGVPSAARPDVSHLVVKDGAIDVPEGSAVKVGHFSGGESLVKTGGGALNFVAGALPSQVDVRGGTISQVAQSEPSGSCALADGPVFHVAADETSSLDVVSEDGVDYVERWHDLSPARNTAWCSISKTQCLRPTVNREDTLNGKPTIDFGESANKGCTLQMAQSIDNARAVYVIYKALSTADYAVLGASGSTSLDAGGSTHNPYSDFLAGGSSKLLYGWNNEHVKNGDIFLDGQPVAYNVNIGTDYHLVEFHTLGGAHVSAIARDRSANRFGGVRVAEIVIYDRELTARERTATRNFLLNKWFPSISQQELPEAETAVIGTPKLIVGDASGVGVADTMKVRDLVGSPSRPVVKDGDGVLEVASAAAFTGTVAVASGVLKLSGALVPAYDSPVLTGRLAHFDAYENLHCDSSGSVTSWVSKVGSVKALPFVTGTKNPYLYDDPQLYGQPSVIMPNRGSLRLADMSDVWTSLSGVKSVFWVIGSHEGGGFVLAGESGTYNFHRAYESGDSPVGSIPGRAILNSSLAGGDIASSTRCAWRQNGVTIKPTAVGFTGGWEVLSMNLVSDSYAVPAIGGFAADARAYPETGAVLKERAGNQRLCEVIFYDHVLTEEEIVRNEAYLNAKWGVNPARTSARNGLEVNLAGGALDCGGTSQFVAGLSGAGTVTNGALAVGGRWTISLNQTGADVVTVAGMLTFEEGVSVRIENAEILPKALYTTWITVATAESIDGLVALNMAEKEVPRATRHVSPCFRISNGSLQVMLAAKGLAISIR